MTLRRPVRQAISSGTTVYATVESYALGKATVRIHGGNRLTNLSTIGGVVSVGDIVVVDYSTGVIPIVRPMFTEAEEEEELDLTSVVLPEAASLVPLEEELPEDLPSYSSLRPDIGCLVHHEMGYINESIEFGFQTVYRNSPTFMYFASNEGSWPDVEWDDHYAAEWTSSGMVDLSSLMGSTHVTIPISGKYIIIVFWNDFISTLVDPLDGYYRVRIFKNYTDVLGTMTGGSLLGDDGEPGINLTRLCALEQGDQISLELYHTYNIDYTLDLWGHYDNISRGMVVQLLPFTVEE